MLGTQNISIIKVREQLVGFESNVILDNVNKSCRVISIFIETENLNDHSTERHTCFWEHEFSHSCSADAFASLLSACAAPITFRIHTKFRNTKLGFLSSKFRVPIMQIWRSTQHAFSPQQQRYIRPAENCASIAKLWLGYRKHRNNVESQIFRVH
jgi:hypothetical protein